MKPILVLGATGYTGERIARALVARGADVILAARRRPLLERLAAELEVANPVRVIDSLEQVDALLDGAGVVINTIGPFQKYGLPIVAAAIAHDLHYLDITGEQAFMQSVLNLLDGPARAHGVAVLCAQAFEYAFSYCGSAALVEKFGAPAGIEIFYRAQGGGISHGTAQSAMGMLGERLVTFRDGRLVAMPRRWTPEHVRFPGETRINYAIPFPGGECLFIPRSLPGIKSVSGYLVTPRLAATVGTGFMAAQRIVRGALHIPGVQGALDRAIDWAAPEPGEAAQASARFSVFIRGTGSKEIPYCLVQGQDVYGTSAQIAAQVAQWLAAGKSRAAGVISTDQAFGARPLLDALAPHGVTYELGTA
ncbi:MAG: saccharopine dehydrogenase NADP-binding domain-containing protein [Anaerolineae bacterium]